MSTNQHSGDSIPVGDIIAVLTALRETFQADAKVADDEDPAGSRWVYRCGKESGVWAAIAAIREMQMDIYRKDIFGGAA